MGAEILSVGSELVCGKNLDTNGRWISQRLSEVGIPVAFHSTVGDDLADIVGVLRSAGERADLVIVTGGLGPTADDLLREAMAEMAGVGLVFDSTSLERIEEMFRARERTMPERNRVQAMFPETAIPIPNDHGTAPGIWMERDDCLYACMPGVPAEMVAMFDSWVLPRLRERFGGGRAIVHRTIRCYGSGESAIEERLGDLTRRGRVPEVGITASEATISLRVTADAESTESARRIIEPDVRFIYDTLGDLIFGEEDATLQSAVAELLKAKRMTLATAESCTGGLVGHLLTEIPGISRYYLGGAVSYSNEAKERMLGVPSELLAEHGAVSPQVAARMAEGARSHFGSDLAIAITGIAGPDGGTPTKPVGLVYVALAHAGGVETAQYNWAAPRSSVKLRSAKTALNLLRLHLQRQ